MHRVGLSRYRETLTLWTTTGSEELSSLGTRDEREEAARLLRSEFGISETVDDAELPILPDGLGVADAPSIICQQELRRGSLIVPLSAW